MNLDFVTYISPRTRADVVTGLAATVAEVIPRRWTSRITRPHDKTEIQKQIFEKFAKYTIERFEQDLQWNTMEL